MSYKKDMAIIAETVDYTDYSDILKSKLYFTYLIDALCKNGDISEKTYNNAYLHIDKKHRKTYLICGSYKQLLEGV